MKANSNVRPFFWPALAGLILRMWWCQGMWPEPVSDFYFYFQAAEKLSQGLGYLNPDFTQAAFYPIGYPLYLSLIFEVMGANLVSVYILNMVSYLLTYQALHLLASRLDVSPRMIIYLLWVYALYPNHIYYCSLASGEVLFGALLLWYLYLSQLWDRRNSWWYACLSACVLAAALYIKPQVALLPLLLTGFRLASSFATSTLWQLAVHYMIVWMMLQPYYYRNYKEFGEYTFTHHYSGYNMYIANRPTANEQYRLDSSEVASIGILPTDAPRVRNEKFRQAALHYIVSRPLHFAGLLLRKCVWMYSNEIDGIYWNLRGKYPTQKIKLKEAVLHPDRSNFPPLYLGFAAIAQLSWIMLLLLAAWSVYTIYSYGAWGRPMWVVLTLCYFAAIHLALVASARYHYYMVPLMLLLIGYAWQVRSVRKSVA